jgi:mycothiol system anti-sigma-R factor
MNCHDVDKFVYVYLDGEFEQREALEFEGHLESCTSCLERVRFEDNYLKGLRTKIEGIRAPQHLREKILIAITNETERVEEASRERAASFAGSWWFSGAFATGLLAIIGWQYLSQDALTNNPLTNPDTSPVQMAGVTSGGLDTINNASRLNKSVDRANNNRTNSTRQEPLVSLVSTRVTEHAVDNHESLEHFELSQDPHILREQLRSSQSRFAPPLPESTNTRLLGARLNNDGLLPQAIYRYDHMGRRVTAVQSLIPKGWGRVQKSPSVSIQRGHKVLTYQDTTGLITSIVCEDTDCDLSFSESGHIRH